MDTYLAFLPSDNMTSHTYTPVLLYLWWLRVVGRLQDIQQTRQGRLPWHGGEIHLENKNIFSMSCLDGVCLGRLYSHLGSVLARW